MAKKPTGTPQLSKDTLIAVLAGPEAFLRSLYTAKIREELTKAHGEIDTFQFDGQSAPAADVLDECRSFGLMASHKLVIVDNADQFVKEANRPLVERYAEHPTENATLVLRSDKWNKGKLDAMIEKVGVIIDCQPLSDAAALAWATKRCEKERRASLDRAAGQLLIERLGTDLGRIDSELEKLATAAGEGGTITAALVAEFVGASREEEVWAIQGSLLSGDPSRTLAHLRDALDVSRQPTVLVSFACLDLARKLHGASAALAGGAAPGSLMKPLKLWGPTLDAVTNAARRVPHAAAASLLADCVKADVRQKTGLGDPGRTLEVVALRFAETINPARGHRPAR